MITYYYNLYYSCIYVNLHRRLKNKRINIKMINKLMAVAHVVITFVR